MSNKKIGLLTFHRVWNAGAFLQTLGLYEMLEAEGYDVCVLDYVPAAHKARFLPRFSRNPFAWRRQFKQARSAYKMADIYAKQLANIKLLAPAKTGSEISSKVDVVISSADVWNYGTKWSHGEWVLFGNDITVSKLIGYAVSLGSTDWETVTTPDVIKASLPTYTAAFPRDYATRDFALRYLNRVYDITLDAAFFIDYMKYVKERPMSGRYIAVYALSNLLDPLVVSELLAYAKAHDLKVIAPAYPHSWVDANYQYINAYEWLNLMYHSEFILTNTFHGTVFSILMGKQFSVVLNSKIRQKTEDMIDLLTLNDCIYKKAGDLRHNFETPALKQETLNARVEASKKELLKEIGN